MYLKAFSIYMKHITIILLTIIFHLVMSGFTNAEELVELQTRPGVTQKFILIKPNNPMLSVILFAGGQGNLELSSDYAGKPVIGWGKGNFLVRSRDLFASHGFMVAVVDAPSDHKEEDGMLYGFRSSQEHVTDIEHVIGYLKKQANIPVWLIGTSRGTESAAHIAIHTEKKINGLVLTSSMAEENDKGTTVTNMAIDRITIPTLVVANEDDDCWLTPPSGAKEIARLLVNSPKVEVIYFSGGDESISKNPCRALTHHGYLGIEEQVVSAIAKWIKKIENF